MLQVVQYQKTGEIKIEELPAPNCYPGGVLVRNSYSLISAGTEKISVTNTQSSLIGRARKQPDQVKLVLDNVKKEGIIATYKRVRSKLDSYKSLGYSTSGVVIESDCDAFAQGDRVACAGVGYANHAELVAVPRNLCVKIPENVSFQEAAFTTLGSIAMQGFRQSDVRLGETVAVIGLGLLGQITVQLLKAAGCKVVGFDIDEKLFSRAKSFGADACFKSSFDSVESVKSFTEGLGCDAAVITASTESNQPLELALEITRKKGKVIIVGAVGMDVPRGPFYTKEIDLRISCSYGPGRYDPFYEEYGIDYPAPYVRWTENRNMDAILKLIAESKLDVKSMLTHEFAVKKAAEAYDLITGKTKEQFLGVAIKYPEREKSSIKTIKTNAEFKKSDVSIGFIGAGSFAQNQLLPALQKTEASFYGVTTSTPVNAKTVADKFGFNIASTDSLEIINDNNVNTVFCAAPHDVHADYVLESLKAGKPVFVEKPLAVTNIQLNDIRDAVEEYSGRVMAGFNRRFSKSFRIIKDFFAERSDPMAIKYRVNAGLLPKTHWVHLPAQGGRIIGEACHFIDCMAFLTGALPVRVYAESVSSNNSEIINRDIVTIIIKFSDGSLGTVEYLANGDSSLPKEYCEVFCERSTAIMNNFDEIELRRAGKRRRISGGSGKGIKEEVKETVEAVKNGKDMPISFNELYAVTRATIAAVESLSSGDSVVI